MILPLPGSVLFTFLIIPSSGKLCSLSCETNPLLCILRGHILHHTCHCCYFTFIWWQFDILHLPHKTTSSSEQALCVCFPSYPQHLAWQVLRNYLSTTWVERMNPWQLTSPKSLVNDLPLHGILWNKVKVMVPGLWGFHQLEIPFSHIKDITTVESWAAHAISESKWLPDGNTALDKSLNFSVPPSPHLSTVIPSVCLLLNDQKIKPDNIKENALKR